MFGIACGERGVEGKNGMDLGVGRLKGYSLL